MANTYSKSVMEAMVEVVDKCLVSEVTMLEASGRRLENLIHATASGPKRNAMCDANIHIKAAINCMQEATKHAAR